VARSPAMGTGATVQRWVRGTWVYLTRANVPSSGSLTVRLARPGRYRVVVAATALSTSAASAGVLVR
jgi:hypothetical protein